MQSFVGRLSRGHVSLLALKRRVTVNFNHLRRWAAACVAFPLLLTLAACGGGSDAPVGPPDTPGAETTIGGTLVGLKGKVVLQNNGTLDVALTSSGNYSVTVAVGTTYHLVVKTQPAGQTCVVANGTGTAVGPVNDILVTCSDNTYPITVEVTGLEGTVVLQINGSENLSVPANGSFSFATPLAHGTPYTVTVAVQPAGMLCSVLQGTGSAGQQQSQALVHCSAVAPPPPPEPPPPPPPPPAPTSAPGLTITYAAKALNFSWNIVADAQSYLVYEDPDGIGPLPRVQIGQSSFTTSLAYAVPVLLHTRLSATYTVQACNASGCGPSSAAVVPDMKQAIGYFKAASPAVEARFGNRVALSADGSTMAVGAYGEGGNTGAVYVFTKTGGTWTQQARIAAPNPDANDYFGNALALSGDGSTLAIGADGESGNQTGTFTVMPATNNLAANAGAVYVYTRSGAAWSRQAFIKAPNAYAGDLFGTTVRLSTNGDTLAVAAYYESADLTGAHGNGAYFGSGAAHVFTRAGGVWSAQGYLKASNAGAGDFFGISLALSGSGDTVAVGAFFEQSADAATPGDNSLSNAGAAYVFQRTGNLWAQQSYLKAPLPEVNDRFGVAVVLSADGNTLGVGMDGESSNNTGVFTTNPADNALALNSGAAFVFVRSGATWSQQAYLKPSNTRTPHRFGNAMFMSADGHTLAVSSYREDSNATGFNGDQASTAAADAGAVFMFKRSGAAWLQSAYLKAPNTGAGDRFGGAVALSADGNTLAVGAASEDGGSGGIGGNQADESQSNSGAVYLY
ncbi:MAG: hypothetical protein KF686_21220 [Ramlibacter sp.]|nr:hypothetical protein [Ramlibacter sp.]